MITLDSLPVRCAVSVIRKFGESEIFCGLRRIETLDAASEPYVLAMDDVTEAAIVYQVGVHISTPNHRNDSVALVGVIVGGGHPALLLAAESGAHNRVIRKSIPQFSFWKYQVPVTVLQIGRLNMARCTSITRSELCRPIRSLGGGSGHEVD